MWRAAAIITAVVISLAQKGDAPVRIKAFLCETSGRDYCGKRSQAGFEPARIRIEVYFTPDPENRQIIYGLRCVGEDEPRAVSGPYDLDARQAFLFVEHRDIGDGECYGVAQLARVHGDKIERLNAQSERILILSRE